jgi:hypothetical protein
MSIYRARDTQVMVYLTWAMHTANTLHNYHAYIYGIQYFFFHTMQTVFYSFNPYYANKCRRLNTVLWVLPTYSKKGLDDAIHKRKMLKLSILQICYKKWLNAATQYNISKLITDKFFHFVYVQFNQMQQIKIPLTNFKTRSLAQFKCFI